MWLPVCVVDCVKWRDLKTIVCLHDCVILNVRNGVFQCESETFSVGFVFGPCLNARVCYRVLYVCACMCVYMCVPGCVSLTFLCVFFS